MFNDLINLLYLLIKSSIDAYDSNPIFPIQSLVTDMQFYLYIISRQREITQLKEGSCNTVYDRRKNCIIFSN